ncbi:endonuclease [Amylibacter ulvae]|uniref:Endonuclease n=1 Tax=Paramylibacter ulvae TaxID=1651968 RepID=A0ABQ3D5G1_9RHOB|nr:endonuclease/exonuclease/phosphatase family protein [Amylibacter ulvae]GHA59760.1 endonuclease [Amylibacter ulvae]
MTNLLDHLPLASAAMRKRIVTVERNASEHRAIMKDFPAMHLLETGGKSGTSELSKSFNVVAWNLERCLFPEDSVAHLASLKPDVILLSEMDSGMSRTAQRNTTAEMAAAAGMSYLYGVEFFELDLGGPTERKFCKDDFNTSGWHGNGMLTSAKPKDALLIRLDDHGHWFAPDENAGDNQQPRVGGRMAVAAIIPTAGGDVCFVSTHLESNAVVAHRHKQFVVLLDAIDKFAPDLPVVIGGDLNTGNHLDDGDWRRETLFDYARSRGYSWDTNAKGVTTQASLITPHLDREMKLDWFCTRGVLGSDAQIINATNLDGKPLADHHAIKACFSS